ncbi:MAG: hypothetical protein KDC87_00110 [Planctomycetes bacterium]|nr:hypothetical protein [Planctomycetota bacterium]MCB9869256.1 hypothetical protein [Planctomycetota bacterium]MCB9889345.1 hypothetical protein [Planctomycetota bacterium]
MKNLAKFAGAVALAAGLAGCNTVSDSYVAQWSGYSVMRGTIVSVENLSGADLQRLADGIAVKVSQAGCKVTMKFENNQSSTMELGPGVVVVYGIHHDYILRSAPGVPAR